MEARYINKISDELQLRSKQVEATVDLLEGGGTVPFIARYRKEATGSLDEVEITAIRDRLAQLKEIDKRRDYILESIGKQGKLTDDLKKRIASAESLTALEDLYLPYKPKRRTKATAAKEKGLEKLAEIIFRQQEERLGVLAEEYVDKEKGVESVDDALAGARDIIAEWVSEDKTAREEIRSLYWKEGQFESKVMKDKEEEGKKYKDYFDWKEPIATAPSHRILAMRRGMKEKFLNVKVTVSEEKACGVLYKLFVKADNECGEQVKTAVDDSFKRLLSLSMGTEMRMETKKRADEEAVKVFANNLHNLLMASPLGQKSVMGIDPGFRTGCKVVWLNKEGKLVHNDTIYPHNSKSLADKEAEKLKKLCENYQIEAVAIGNGTASRETEQFVRKMGLSKDIAIVMVNESGASIYSASEAAREEFPDHDITVRGAVSIGRRLMDPLAELVKIDPKSIGVGQYQHDVDQKLLKRSLDDTVVSCVNSVGVEVNTASKQLLTYVAGVGPQLAESLVSYRDENGAFKSRDAIKNVSGLGDKTFEQCAGFLRVQTSDNPLDKSAVHPESYGVVEKMASDMGCEVGDLMENDKLRANIRLEDYVTDKVGLPTLEDIMQELQKPGRDPREKFEAVKFAEGINEITDLKAGMVLEGVVTNVTNFGAFVDIGVHQDGLIHISELTNSFVKDPATVISVNDKVKVKVLDVDVERKRISLSKKQLEKSSEKNNEKKQRPRQNRKNRENSSRKPKSTGEQTLGDFLNIGGK